jgi:NitT/TauT family transport system substrate-binding protein
LDLPFMERVMQHLGRPLPLNRRSFIAGTGGAVALAALSSASFGQKGRVAVGNIPFNVATPIYAEGIDAWKQEGLEVDVQMFQAGPMVLEAIIAGSIPTGDAGYIPALHRIVRGAPLIFCAADGYATKERPWDRLLVAEDSPYRSLKDLAGKTIAVVARGTVQDILLGVAAQANGMKKSDFEIAVVPSSAMPLALKNKQVDAVYTNSPSDIVMELQGARHLIDTTDFLPYMTIGGLVMSEPWAEKNSGEAVKLIKGWIRAGRWINANREKAKEIATRTLKLTPDVGAKQRIVQWPLNGRHLMPNLWMTYNMMVDTGAVKAVDDPKAMMQRHFIDPALKYTSVALNELGEVPDPDTDAKVNSPLPFLPGPLEEYMAPWERKKT